MMIVTEGVSRCLPEATFVMVLDVLASMCLNAKQLSVHEDWRQ
ncbi:MAG: hypothetical protein PUC87_00125 [Galactobacillus timonensis]|nr:hypothetical protein [Galactobacillus timonensis]